MLDGKNVEKLLKLQSANCDRIDLVSVLEKVKSENTEQAQKLLHGDERIRKWFIGQVMRETKGYVILLQH